MRLITLLLSIALIHAPAQQSDWGRLRELQPGQKVVVLTTDGKFAEGPWQTWSENGLGIQKRNRSHSIPMNTVRRVSVQQKGSRMRSALIGAAVGFGVAFPFGAAWAGYIVDRNSPPLSTRLGLGAGVGMFGAGIGAAIGALAGGTKNVVVYETDKRR